MVTRSPTHGKERDEADAEIVTPITCSSEEIPNPTSNKFFEHDDGAALTSDSATDEVKSKDKAPEQNFNNFVFSTISLDFTSFLESEIVVSVS